MDACVNCVRRGTPCPGRELRRTLRRMLRCGHSCVGLKHIGTHGAFLTFFKRRWSAIRVAQGWCHLKSVRRSNFVTFNVSTSGHDPAHRTPLRPGASLLAIPAAQAQIYQGQTYQVPSYVASGGEDDETGAIGQDLPNGTVPGYRDPYANSARGDYVQSAPWRRRPVRPRLRLTSRPALVTSPASPLHPASPWQSRPARCRPQHAADAARSRAVGYVQPGYAQPGYAPPAALSPAGSAGLCPASSARLCVDARI